ncbi:MAG: hypothetical protein WD512_03950, partial [Candidatus Paceibacterota bacterium]
MRFFLTISLIHLSLNLKAQVFNNAYNNYSHVFYMPVTSEYIFNYDIFGDIVFRNDNSLYCFGASTLASTYWGNEDLVYNFVTKINQFGDTIATKEFLI